MQVDLRLMQANDAVMPEGEDSGREVAARWGRALRKLRGSAKQDEVAVALGYHPTTYSRIENGQVGPPTLERILRALEYYGISPELFWTLIEAPAVEAKPGVDPEILRRLALSEELATRILEMTRQSRLRAQELDEQNESPLEG